MDKTKKKKKETDGLPDTVHCTLMNSNLTQTHPINTRTIHWQQISQL